MQSIEIKLEYDYRFGKKDENKNCPSMDIFYQSGIITIQKFEYILKRKW